MKHCLITFRSVTPAQRAEQVLRQGGFVCSLQRTPKWMEQQGCGYSLRIRCENGAAAAALLQKHRIAFRKIYRQERENLEELPL